MDRLKELYDNKLLNENVFKEIKELFKLKNNYINELLERDKEWRILVDSMPNGEIVKGYKLYDFKYLD